MLSAGKLRFSTMGEEGDQMLFPTLCVCLCVQCRDLMDINIEETVINALTTL